jgi:FkbM family methyltransferase
VVALEVVFVNNPNRRGVMADDDEDQNLTTNHPSVSGRVSLKESLAAYETVISRFGNEAIINPGRIEILGWDLEYVCGSALASFIDQILVRRLNDFIPSHDEPTILDCGANIGFTVLNYRRQFPKARIVAFEPDPQFVPVLHRNLNRNGAADVDVVEAAAWIHQGKAWWFCEGIDGSKIIKEAEHENVGAIRVATIDLAYYLRKPVDLLKLDIEGSEYAVIMHLGRKLRNVRNILIECHLNQSNIANFGQMLKILVSRGFKLSINTFGPWRDLIRQSAVAPHHWEQYMVVAGWRNAIPEFESGDTTLPYLGAQRALELQTLGSEAANLREVLNDTRSSLESLANRRAKAKRLQLEMPSANDGGFCWRATVPGLEYCADNAEQPRRSRLLLMESGKLLGPPHALHADIRNAGAGRYSHWNSNLFFSTPDNTDPNTNGRTYWMVIA